MEFEKNSRNSRKTQAFLEKNSRKLSTNSRFCLILFKGLLLDRSNELFFQRSFPDVWWFHFTDTYQVLYLPPVWFDGQVGVDAGLLVSLELWAVSSAQDVDVLLNDFHVGLETDVASRRALKHEPEI